MPYEEQLPPYLYYYEKSDEAVYGTTPIGQINVNRFIEGRPYWRQPITRVVAKPRTIVLADWRVKYEGGIDHIAQSDNLLLIPKINLLMQLLDNNFEIIYFDKDKKAITLTKENFDPDKLTDYLSYCLDSREALEESIVSQKKINKDKLFILDDIWMDQICSDAPDDMSQPRIISTYYYHELAKDVNNPEKLKSIIGRLDKRYTNYTGKLFILNENERIEFESMKRIDIDQKAEIHRYGNNVDQATQAELNNFTCAEVRYQDLKDDKESCISLSKRISKLQNLIEIEFTDVKLCDFKLDRKLKKVEILVIKGMEINSSGIENILSCMPNLRKIVINGLIINGDLESKVNLSSLSKLVIDPTRLLNKEINHDTVLASILNVIKMIPHSDSLHEIRLTNIRDDDVVDLISKINFPALTVIKISESDLTIKALSNLLYTYSNIEKFIVSCKAISFSLLSNSVSNVVITEINDDVIRLLSNDRFKSMTSLTMNVANVKITEVVKLMSALPFLKELTIQAASIETDVVTVNTATKLEKLTLTNYNDGKYRYGDDIIKLSLSNSSAEKILNIGANISELNISHVNLSGMINIANPLPNLKKLLFDHTSLDSGVIEEIIEKSQSSIELKVSSSEYDIRKITKSFKNLTSISWQYPTPDTIMELIGASTTLKKLELELFDCKISILPELSKIKDLEFLDLSHLDLEGISLEFKLQQLKTLKIIELRNNQVITYEMMIAILNRMPNLEKLELLLINWRLPSEKKHKDFCNYLKLRGINYNKELEYEPEDKSKIENTFSPDFNAATKLDFKPKTKFSYSNVEDKSQRMIMDRLGWFIEKNHPDYVKYLDKSANGICHALSLLFIDNDSAEWNHLLGKIQDWKGDWVPAPDKDTLDSLNQVFEVWKSVYVQGGGQAPGTYTFFGDGLEDFLRSSDAQKRYLIRDNKFFLSNPWHSVALKFSSKANPNHWKLYDPNYPDGYKIFTLDKISDLIFAIEKSLGTAVGLNVSSLPTEMILPLPSQFISDGGLIGLPYLSNTSQVLDILQNSIDSLPVLALQNGLFVRTNSGIPAFLVVFMSNNNEVALYTLKLLNKLMSIYKSQNRPFSDAVRNSMDCIAFSGTQHNELMTKFIQLKRQINMGSRTHDYDEIFDVIINSLPIERASKKESLIEKKKEQKEEKNKIPEIRVNPINEEKMKKEAAGKSLPITKKTVDQPDHIDKRRNLIAQLLETWVRKPIESPTTFLQQMVSISSKTKTSLADKKRLVEFTSPEQVKIFLQATQQYCQSINRPIFYVHSPEDLICSAPFIERIGDNGYLRKGPGGRLHQFLSREFSKDNPPLILVNYDRFTSEDIVQFNGLLDEVRNADGTKLPEEAIVLGARNMNKPGCYQGMDYYSRFTSRKEIPASIVGLSLKLPDLTIPEKTEEGGETIKINLFQGNDWKENLEGQWIMQGKELRFKEGLLAVAIKSGKPIEIQNAPWNNSDFVNYWEQALLTRRIEHSGGVIHLPENLKICKTQGYDKHLILAPEQVITGFDQSTLHTINPTNFSQFFVNYQCIDEKLETKAGIIAANAHGELHLNITRDLNENQWAQLLQECEDHQVKLICHRTEKYEKTSFNPDAKAANSIIESTDIDVTVKQLTENDKWIVIDITDCEPTDLLVRLDAKINDNMEFGFSENINVLKRALDENKNIILKGHPSETLADTLASLMFQRGKKENTNRIAIVCDDASYFSSFPVQKDEIKPETRKRFLAKKYGDSNVGAVSDKLDKENYAVLEARLAYRQRMVGEKHINDDDAWLGMKRLPGGVDLPPFNPDQSDKITQAFIQERREGVAKVLENSPYVFLTGLTGVGKSTFVEQDLLVNKVDRLYKGESALEAFAKDSAPGRKYLFIDEANVTSRSWSEFEGLFNDPPGLLINGTYYPLDKDTKVIFAGNPMSYGDRAMAQFFARHGNALVFNPLPTEFIYEKIIKPVFKSSSIPQDQLVNVARHCLEVYQYICKQSKTEVLISPREVQMMALLTLSHMERNPSDKIENVAKHYARIIGRQVLPDNMKNDFDKQFPLTEKIAHATLKEHDDEQYLITPSRQPVIDLLSDILILCEARQNNPDQNTAQLYGGLGGMVIEGEPGIGKSELVMSVLNDRGYQRVTLDDAEIPDKAFYYMPVSMPLDQKKELLLKAFNQGAKVVIDEINSSPMMERLLNDLLMGKSPDGKRPDKPGFMIIGTQNPVTMAGRRELSRALARRLISTILPSYSIKEMVDILVHKGMQSDDAKLFVDVYQEKLAEAHARNLKPAPTFRDLLRKADEFMEHISSEPRAEIEEDLSMDMSVPREGHTFRLFAHPEDKVEQKVSEAPQTSPKITDL